jgi:bacteriorhodopsin
MAYFAMLSGQGWTAIAGCRQFFYARYVDWSITTPIILLELGLIAGADTSTIAAAIGADSEYRYRLSVLQLKDISERGALSWTLQQDQANSGLSGWQSA